MSSFSIVKPSYLENTNNIIINGNLTVNGTVTNYIDTSLNSLPENAISFFGSFTGTNKWASGVLAPNGKIYCAPSDATSVLIIDPTTNTADTTTISGLPSTTDKWRGGVLAQNGKIYFAPLSASNVLIVDPISNTADTTTISGLTGGAKWIGGVLASNGNIYCIPYDLTRTNIMVINTGLPKLNSWIFKPYFNKL